MLLKNKKTGEIVETDYQFGVSIPTERTFGCPSYDQIASYNSLAELNENWEDYEEPKGIKSIGTIGPSVHIEMGSEEEAEKAVEKLKAWKRLKEHNLRVERGQRVFVNADNKLASQKPLFVMDTYEEVEDDLDLLFGGEE